jgi:hypothetical protein
MAHLLLTLFAGGDVAGNTKTSDPGIMFIDQGNGEEFKMDVPVGMKELGLISSIVNVFRQVGALIRWMLLETDEIMT